MARKKPEARVELRSPATGGTALVPASRVDQYRRNGWQAVEAKPKRAAKKAEPTGEGK